MSSSINRKPKSIKSIIDQIVKDKGLDDELSQSVIAENWDSIVGEKIAEFTKIRKLNKGVLILQAESSTLRTEILLREEQLIKKINKILNNNTVTTIVVR